MAKFNPFQNPTKEQVESKEKAVAEAAKRLQALKTAAAECLKHEQFSVYSEKLKRTEEELVRLFLAIDTLDPVQLWKVQSLQSELRAIRGVMSIVGDAR